MSDVINIKRGKLLQTLKEEIRKNLPDRLFGRDGVNQSPQSGEIIDKQEIEAILMDYFLGSVDAIKAAGTHLIDINIALPGIDGKRNEIVEGIEKIIRKCMKIDFSREPASELSIVEGKEKDGVGGELIVGDFGNKNRKK